MDGINYALLDVTLYSIGARNLVVNNIGPLGCLPSVINKTGNGQCDEQMNQNIMPYNSKLPQTLKNIQDEYPDATLTLANSHDLLQDILADTEKYGFTDVKDPCCGAYVNGKLACIPNSTPCDNRCQISSLMRTTLVNLQIVSLFETCLLRIEGSTSLLV
ncbi:GDSL esterase/lipase At1g71691-like [Camellia sinensis]|uniref:GDSL esterase/lipase At1g71691-like n=1 Tax=Camellia sinensis TaxID=4442 RepID=UPI001035F0C0|nr:GDSL esterase/lipase At1g71691-like [Camellia sinensis]